MCGNQQYFTYAVNMTTCIEHLFEDHFCVKRILKRANSHI